MPFYFEDGENKLMKNYYNEKFLIKGNEIFLGLALVLFVFSVVIEMTVFTITGNGNDNEIFMMITKIMRYMAYALCVFKICMDQKVQKSWLIYVVLIAVILSLGMIIANSTTMFLYFWIISACTGITDKKILRTVMYVQMSILCVTVLMSQTGIIQDFIDGERERHYLGFTWTTTAPILFFYIILQYLYICDMQLTVPKFILFMIINVWFFVMTNTRLAFVLLSATLIFALLYNYTFIKKLRLEKLKYLFILAPEGIALFSIGLHAFYDSNSSLWQSLDDLLTGRLHLGYEAIQEYGFSLFGQKITWYGNGLRSQVGQEGIAYNYVDCSYLQILLQYGLVFLIIVLLAYSIIMWKAIQEKRYSACWVILVILIFAITEPRLVNMAFNPFILLVFTKAEVEEKTSVRSRTSNLNLVLSKGELQHIQMKQIEKL